jgi:hypothetical protein
MFLQRFQDAMCNGPALSFDQLIIEQILDE